MVQEQNIWEIRKQIQDNTFRWYVLSVVSGQEQLVIDNMKERIQKPIVNEYSMRKWEKITKQKKLYPGYVFIKSRMNDKIWYIVRNTPGVRLIVWAETRPIPLTDQEYEDMINHIKKSEERSSLKIPYKEWDVVMLKSWDFKWMKWNIKTIDHDKWTVVVNIEMLGRLTPVAVDADKIELMS